MIAQVRQLDEQLDLRVFANSTLAFGIESKLRLVGNRQTTLVQNQRCCGVESYLTIQHPYVLAEQSGMLATLSL